MDGLADSAARAAGASDRAADSARDYANASDRANSSAGDLGQAVSDLTRAHREQAAAADRAADSALSHAAATDRAGESSRSFADWADKVAQSMNGSEASAVRAAGAVNQLGAETSRATRFMVDAGGAAEQISSGMAPIESGAARAASGMKALTAGTSEATSAGKDWTDGWSGRASTADSAAASFRVLGGSASSAGGSLRATGSELSKVAESGSAVSKVFDASNGAFNFKSDMPSVWKSLGSEIGNVSSGLAGLGDKAEAGLSGMSVGVQSVGMGALYATAGIGILTAAAAGIGVAGAFGDVAKSAPMMNEARNAMKDFTHEFSAMSGATSAAGLAPMKGLSATVKELGGELAKVGVQNVGGILGGASTLVASATGAIGQLEPAIGPAITAATSLGKAVIGAFGNSGDAITSFANTVTAQSPGIQAGLEGAVKVAGQIGEIAVKAAGTLGPGIGSDSGETVAGGIGQFLKSISPKWLQSASDAVDRAMGVHTDAQGNVMTGAVSASDSPAFGAGEASTPHAAGMKPGAVDASGAPRAYAPGEFAGSSFGWHMPAGSAPLVAGASNDMSGVQSDMMGGAGSGPTGGGGTAKQAPPSKPGGAYGAPIGGAASPVGLTAGSDAPGGAATPPPPPPPTPGGAAAGKSGLPAASPGATGGFGSGAPSAASAANVAQLQSATTATQGLTAAQNQLAPAAAAAGAAGAAAGSSLGAMGQSAQGAAQATQGAAQQAAPAAQAMQAAAAPPPAPPAPPPPPPAPPPPAAPAAAAVAKTTAAVVSSAAPAAASGGADIGASMGSGMGVGVTKEITNTLTIVKKWIVRVVETAAGALDAHSPSRVFANLGESLPTGLIVGIQAQTPASVAAAKSMIDQVTQASQAAMVNGQAQLAKTSAATYSPTASTAAQQAQAAQGTSPTNPKPTPAGSAQKAAENDKKAKDEDKKKAAEMDRQATFEANKAGLMKRGMSENSAEAKAKLEQVHNDAAKKLRDQRQADHADATLRARGLTPQKTGDPIADAAANEKLATPFTDRQLKHDTAKDAALKLLGVRPLDGSSTDPNGPGHGAPQGNPLNPRAADQAKKFAEHQTDQARAKGDLGKLGSDTGTGMMGGMTDGINKGAGGPADAAGKAADDAVNKVKQKTKTKSPSQVFHDIGGNFMQGWTDGVHEGRRGFDKEWDDIDSDLKGRADKWGSMYPTSPSSGAGGGGGGGGGAGGGGGGGGSDGQLTPWNAHASSRWGPPPGSHGSHGDDFDAATATPAQWAANQAKQNARIERDSKAMYQAHLSALAQGEQAAEAAFTPNVQGNMYRDPVSGGTKNGVSQGFNKDGSIQYNPYADALAGGFGSGVTTASNGVLGLASSAGLTVGNAWARSVIDGSDSVLTKADFTAAAIPALGSDLAKTALGIQNMLGPAGSGAMVAKVNPVTLGAGVAAQPQVHNWNLYIDGQQVRVIANEEIGGAISQLASSISRQVG